MACFNAHATPQTNKNKTNKQQQTYQHNRHELKTTKTKQILLQRLGLDVETVGESHKHWIALVVDELLMRELRAPRSSAERCEEDLLLVG